MLCGKEITSDQRDSLPATKNSLGATTEIKLWVFNMFGVGS